MSKNTISVLSVLLILSGVVGLEMSGLAATFASVFAISVGMLGVKNVILD